MIVLNVYQIVVISTSHVVFQSWEIIIESIGINRILGITPLVVFGLSVLINIVFILGAMLFIR